MADSFKAKIKSIQSLIISRNFEDAKDALENLLLEMTNKLEEIHRRRDELAKNLRMKTGVGIAVDKANEAFRLVFQPYEDKEKERFFEEYQKLMKEVDTLESQLTQILELEDLLEEAIKLQGKDLA